MSFDVDYSRLLAKLQNVSHAVQQAVEDTSAKAAEEIHEKAIEYASGPMNPDWKARQARTARRSDVKNGGRRVVKVFKDNAEYLWYREVMREGRTDAPWPVSANTGTFRQAHKRERIGRGVWRVYGDSKTANYFAYVHNGTIHMKPRPTIGKAVQEFKQSRRVQEIGRVMLQKRLREVK
ncbi:HK97-gp10 family putative phage morphogenesis protein [Brevibacillus agri]|uniref:HK97-gp10 family putative phage morphogenesis protein n=1 Tax=Brevibacillus agri TaxID=51101 RepID=UPI002867B8CB|nr:HK97-gp10 family putative phage morphogenesis protein [Brevibacillus agri]